MNFDHTYQIVPNGDTHKDLIARGFKPSDETVNHPKQLTCQFIGFRHEEGGEFTYLEFCFHNTTLPKDPEEFGSDVRDLLAGFSLRSPDSLEAFQTSNRETLAPFEPKFVHKNYEWAKDNTSRLPGWNFITFQKDPVKGIYIWMTEYERRTDQTPPPRTKIEHPNTASRIAGFIWQDITAQEKADLVLLTGGKLKEDKLHLPNGRWIRFVDSSWNPTGFLGQKSTKYLAVVIEVSSMETFRTMAKPHNIFEENGTELAHIQLGTQGWDILAYEAPADL